MSYCIEYTSGTKRKYPKKTKKFPGKVKILWFTAALCVALLLIPGVGDALKRLLLPGDPAVTEAAIISMAERLGAGERLYDAVTVFCREIIQGAAA